MASPYKRRKPSIARKFWVYRRLVGLALVLGLMLWFIWANNTPVTVNFPLRLGKLDSSLGLVILLSALVGAVATGLTMTMIYAWRRMRAGSEKPPDEETAKLPEDRPPAGYAAKASEAPPDENWP
jgi:uncharacterized integral membrane protein